MSNDADGHQDRNRTSVPIYGRDSEKVTSKNRETSHGTVGEMPLFEEREARVNRACDGEPLGVALFLGAEDLEQLDLETTDSDTVKYIITGGGVCVSPTTTDTKGGDSCQDDA